MMDREKAFIPEQQVGFLDGIAGPAYKWVSVRACSVWVCACMQCVCMCVYVCVCLYCTVVMCLWCLQMFTFFIIWQQLLIMKSRPQNTRRLFQPLSLASSPSLFPWLPAPSLLPWLPAPVSVFSLCSTKDKSWECGLTVYLLEINAYWGLGIALFPA